MENEIVSQRFGALHRTNKMRMKTTSLMELYNKDATKAKPQQQRIKINKA